MANWFQAKEFLKYRLTSRGIHSIHSPFVFDFIQNVLHDKRSFYCYEEVENLRQQLLLSEETVQLNDLGAGSKISQDSIRLIRSIAKDSATPAKYAQLLFRIGVHYECKSILELGTSLGLTALYLSAVSKDARVVTIEGDERLAAVAEKHFQSLRRKNITLFQGSFESKLPIALNQAGKIDLAYVDGNHRYDSTMNYFNRLPPFVHDKSVVIIGDIHWSSEMKRAWKEIRRTLLVTASIDLFYIGVIFFRKELSKQDFVIRW